MAGGLRMSWGAPASIEAGNEARRSEDDLQIAFRMLILMTSRSTSTSISENRRVPNPFLDIDALNMHHYMHENDYQPRR